jgi:hypothetical protein
MKENEREFQRWITDVAQTYGWKFWHLPTPMRPIGGNKFVPDPRGRGFPDLVLMHDDPPRLIFAEVKDEKGVLSDAQREFLQLARLVADKIAVSSTYPAIGVYLWRPANRDLIEATLKGAHL